MVIEFNLGAQKAVTEQNFAYLQLLVRGMTNVLILEPEQKQLLVLIQ